MARAPRKTQTDYAKERCEANKMRLQENPLRILKLLARAQTYSEATFRVINGSVDPGDAVTPQLRVEFTIQRSGYPDDTILSGYPDDTILYVMGSEEYEFVTLEHVFDLIDAEKAEAERKRKIAREAYDSLTEEQRDALGVRYRP